MNWEKLETFPEVVDDSYRRYEDIDYANGKLFAINQAGFFQILHNRDQHIETIHLGYTRPGKRPRCLSIADCGNVGVIGLLSEVPNNQPRIIRTDDGGTNWRDISPKADVGPQMGICGIHTSDGQNIWAAGSYHANGLSNGVIFSDDGGSSWSQSLSCQSAVDIDFDEAGNGIVVGREDGWPSIWCFDSKNGDWNQASLPKDDFLKDAIGWKVFRYKREEILVSISVENMGGVSAFFSSTDDGESWTKSELSLQGKLHGIGRDAVHTWLGVRKNSPMMVSQDRSGWIEVLDQQGADIVNINRIISTERGYYAAGDSLYETS